jgi:1-acyl-sn-glycerol-3-phosphate acyltransferase
MDTGKSIAIEETEKTTTTTQDWLKKIEVPIKAARIVLHILMGVFIAMILGFWLKHRFEFQRTLIQWWLQKVCYIVGLTIEIKGGDPKSGLIVSNHISWLDIIVIGGHFPIRFLSKAEVRQWPVIGWLAECGGTLFIKRGNGQAGQMAKTIADELSSGESILVFPEATSTDGKQVKRFFPNMFTAAIQAKVTVQPMSIQYRENGILSNTAPFVGDDEFVEHMIRVLHAGKITVELTILDAISPETIENDEVNKKTLSDLARQRIISSTLAC